MIVRCLLVALIAFGSIAYAFDPLDYLASKSPYPVPKEPPKIARGLERCRPIFINHVGRHGSRHLTHNEGIEDLAALVAKAAQEQALEPLGAKFTALLEKAKKMESTEALGQLTDQGRNEHRGIGERMFSNFRDLFLKSPVDKPIMVESTYVKRTKESLQAFLNGLTNLDPRLLDRVKISAPEKGVCNPNLRFFDSCNAYVDYLEVKQPWKQAVSDAIWTPDAKAQVKKVLSQIFSRDFVNKLDDKEQIGMVRNIYNLCQLVC